MKSFLLAGLLVCLLSALSGCASDLPKTKTTTSTTETTTVRPANQ